jgi:COMM domain containing 7
MQGGYSVARFESRSTELGLSEGIVQVLSKLWKKRAVQVATSLLAKAMTNNQLVDMDWVFGVTAASDDCDHVGKTFLQLKLTLNGELGRQVVLMELSLDQFYQFLASMEKCQTYLDYVYPPTSTSNP